MAFQHVQQTHNGLAKIAYAIVSPEIQTRPSVCLIASTGRGPEDFHVLAKLLAEAGFRVLLPWPRGIGGSLGSLEEIDFHNLAADVAAVIEAEMNPHGFLIAGHAYGCWIARTLAENRPDLILGVVLLAAGGGSWPDELTRAIDVAMSPENPENERVEALQLAFFAAGHDARPWLDGWHRHLAAAQRLARTRTNRESWWSSGTAPILDLVGLQDPFRPASGRDFYQREFPGRVTLVTVDKASHALPEEQPEAVVGEICKWNETSM